MKPKYLKSCIPLLVTHFSRVSVWDEVFTDLQKSNKNKDIALKAKFIPFQENYLV